MRLMIVADQLFKHGGIERVICGRIAYWFNHRPDLEITLLTYEHGKEPFAFDVGGPLNHIDLGIGYDRQRSLSSVQNLHKAWQHRNGLARAIKAIKPDTIICTGYGFDFYLLPLLASGRRLIKENHSSRAGMPPPKANLKARVRSLFEARYHNMVFLSEEEAGFSTHPNKVVIPNPVPTMPSQPADKRQNVVMAAGRIAPVKGFERLIDSWALVCQSVQGWQLHIVGDGHDHYMQALEERAKMTGHKESICFSGACDDVPAKMRTAGIYAMTSLSECFPMVLLESMYNHLPIVAMDCPTGPRNLITHNATGVLVADADVAAMATALIELINDQERRQGLAEQAFDYVQQFSEEKIGEKWNSLLDSGH